MSNTNFSNLIEHVDQKKIKEIYDGTPILNYLNSFTPNSLGTKVAILINGESLRESKIPGVTISEPSQDDFLKMRNDYPLSSFYRNLKKESFKITVDKTYSSNIPLKLEINFKEANLNAPLLFVEIKKEAKVTIIEKIKSSNESEFLFSENYFSIDTNAQCEHIQIVDFNKESSFHGSYFTEVKKDGSYSQIALSLGGKLCRLNSEVSLLGSGSHGEIFSLYLTTDKEHADFFTKIEHKSEDSTSAQIAKGILSGNSKGIFTGKIHIHPKAQRVSSSQLNRNLLLSEKAHANSRPQLEIFADDVKCSHGSTTGQISDEELFYFESRGIPKVKARSLLAYGFGQEVVLKIKNTEALLETKKILKEALFRKYQIGENL